MRWRFPYLSENEPQEQCDQNTKGPEFRKAVERDACVIRISHQLVEPARLIATNPGRAVATSKRPDKPTMKEKDSRPLKFDPVAETP